MALLCCWSVSNYCLILESFWAGSREYEVAVVITHQTTTTTTCVPGKHVNVLVTSLSWLAHDTDNHILRLQSLHLLPRFYLDLPLAGANVSFTTPFSLSIHLPLPCTASLVLWCRGFHIMQWPLQRKKDMQVTANSVLSRWALVAPFMILFIAAFPYFMSGCRRRASA